MWPFTINKNAPYRTRSMDNVIDELKFIKQKLPYVKEIFIQDDTLPKPRVGNYLRPSLKTGSTLYGHVIQGLRLTTTP